MIETKSKEINIMSITEDWNIYKLSDIIEIIGGGTPKTSIKDYWDGDIPWISVVDFNNDSRWVYNTEKTITKKGLEKSSTKILKKGQLIISARGTVGEIAQLDKNMAFNQSCYGLSGSEEITNDFLYYLLKHNIKDLKARAHGSVFDTITRNTFDQISVNIPSLEKQHSIVDVLTSLDLKIELNRQMNTILEHMAQAIFKHWFIDFEFPDEDGQPYRSNGGDMIYSELEEIPVGWRMNSIGDVCKIIGGGTPKTKELSYWENGDVFWATPTDMTSLKSPIIFDTSRKITEKGLQNSSAKLLPIGSILMTSRATLGYFAINKVPLCTNQGFISMICEEGISNYYSLNAVKNKMDMIESLAGGSTYPEISKTVFKAIKIIVPPAYMLKKFDEIAEPIYERIYHNELETVTLSQIRDSILPKLMTGKIRVECRNDKECTHIMRK